MVSFSTPIFDYVYQVHNIRIDFVIKSSIMVLIALQIMVSQ